MGLLKDFRDFAMRGNVIDLAVGVIIGYAFGDVTKSIVNDILMPPIGKIAGNLDFSNMYISLSEKVDAANAASRISLADARKIGPVIAYGNFITIAINFLIVTFCIFLIVKLMTMAMKRFEKEQAATPPAPAPEVVLLTEIRDLLQKQ